MRFYDFVRDHVIPFNSVIAMSVTVAVVLDFLAPQAPYLAWVSYLITLLLMLAIVLELRCRFATVPADAWYVRLLGRLRSPPGPLWETSSWQAIGIIAITALILGQVSKAHASSGGMLASATSGLRNLQVQLLGLKEDSRRIQSSLDGMGTKVDSIHATVGELGAALKHVPAPASSESDLSRLQALATEGKRFPQDPYQLLKLLNQKRDDRLAVMELYLRHEFDIHRPMPLSLMFVDLSIDDALTIKNLAKLEAWADKKYQLDGSTLMLACQPLDLQAYAAIAGDKQLSEWLSSKGVQAATQHPCKFVSRKWQMSAKDIQDALAQ